MAGTSPAMTREKWFNVTGIRSSYFPAQNSIELRLPQNPLGSRNLQD
jgi:hypothetical protein